MSPNPKSEDAELARWYQEEVLVHEPALRGYLRRAFTKLSDVDDLVQETFARVLRARRETTVRSVRGLVFATARHAALDRLRREQIVAIETLAEIEALPVCDDAPAVHEAVARKLDREELRRAIDTLPARCREVLVLRKIEGLSQREIALRLGISEHTVEVQVANGVRRCTEHFRQRGWLGPRPS